MRVQKEENKKFEQKIQPTDIKQRGEKNENVLKLEIEGCLVKTCKDKKPQVGKILGTQEKELHPLASEKHHNE